MPGDSGDLTGRVPGFYAHLTTIWPGERGGGQQRGRIKKVSVWPGSIVIGDFTAPMHYRKRGFMSLCLSRFAGGVRIFYFSLGR